MALIGKSSPLESIESHCRKMFRQNQNDRYTKHLHFVIGWLFMAKPPLTISKPIFTYKIMPLNVPRPTYHSICHPVFGGMVSAQWLQYTEL